MCPHPVRAARLCEAAGGIADRGLSLRVVRAERELGIFFAPPSVVKEHAYNREIVEQAIAVVVWVSLCVGVMLVIMAM